jgi:hypothetical protein
MPNSSYRDTATFELVRFLPVILRIGVYILKLAKIT